MSAGGKLTVSSAVHRGPSTAVVLSFTDTGMGMAPEKQKHLFEPFLTTKSHGTGLGLAIVQKIIEAHRGKIEVDSKPQKGTTFRILLPT
jgi:two-component system sensor histidine kinase HydH